MRERCSITVTAARGHEYRDANLEGVDVAETILDVAVDDELCQTQNLTTQVERVAEPRLLSLLHTHPFNGPFYGTTRVSRYCRCRTDLDFTVARDSEWQWHHQLGRMQVCTSLHTDNHASTPPSFLQAGRPSCRPTNSVKALKAKP